ncbi:MAG: tyrosine-type recombinase/integrase [Proteobacteria bacterium]|nr:tyrosine-type recombinase/integrase [Pseudomonadota bacterium]
MKVKITKRAVEAIAPGARDVFLWDTELPGFGCKITPRGARVYVLQYWAGGRARRYTLGRHGQTMTTEEARREAMRLKGVVARGADPAAVRAADRAGPTLTAFAERYLADHASVKKKPASAAADERNLRNHILPALGRLKLADISRAHVVKFHQDMRAKPGAANRCLALLSKMFNLAETWGLRPDWSNPTRHVEKYREKKIERFLSEAELARLGAVLAKAERSEEHPSVVAAVRLLIFTGCRRAEILKLEWEHVDFERACLRLPDSKTGAKVVPLGAPALDLLSGLARVEGNPYVLPGKVPGRPYIGIGKAWRRLRARAGLADVRLHDLRHSFASTAAGMGESLVLIGSILGHAKLATTARYAHLSNDPRQAAADRISRRLAAMLEGKQGEVVPLRPAR